MSCCVERKFGYVVKFIRNIDLKRDNQPRYFDPRFSILVCCGLILAHMYTKSFLDLNRAMCWDIVRGCG